METPVTTSIETPSSHTNSTEILCFSAQTLKPFLAILSQKPEIPGQLLETFRDLDPKRRIPISAVLKLLNNAIQLTGDEDLGLRAARAIDSGDFDVLEYAASSSATLREAIEIIQRYIRLLDDSADFSLQYWNGKASLVLNSILPLNRAATDFRLAGVYRGIFRSISSDEHGISEVWFRIRRPEKDQEYTLTFPKATLRFQMPFDAVVFDAELLDAPLINSDPKLHDVLRQHMEVLLSERPRTESLTERVRKLIETELPKGKTNAVHIASILDMSRRTLTRRLEQEGTSYKTLLDDLRRRLALRYLETTRMDMGKIAYLLGFSQTTAFHRAFRRWTDYTPHKYRREVHR
ncbi:MAG: AraC family transcriptional regulator ligand-binding domain-containing protein [Deltaproteobacteria bacterium]|nr:AraC family transcriptional regulator ligand-binding domain-containing protein [Deltaproteobacteria bacterium]